MPQYPAASAPSAWIVENESAREIEIWSLTTSERHRRLLARAGCESIDSLGASEEPDALRTPSVMIVRSDAILDERLIKGLFAARNTILVANRKRHAGWGGAVAAHVDSEHAAEALRSLRRAAEGEQPSEAEAHASGIRLVAASDLAPAYSAQLRKYDPPYIYPARAERIREVEDRIFDSSYKGATDLVTKWLWPRPAAAVVRVLARAQVQPNTVTALSWVLAVVAGVLFWKGSFALGLLCGWLMTFLDTVDGKLARVTLPSSPFGHIFDHALDLIHPPLWYLAWGIGATGGVDAATIVVIAGYLIGRGLEGIFILAFEIETHCWRPIDTLFRTITARRNPNLLLLTVGALGGRPDLGMVMVAIWTVVCMGFHIERILQALFEKSRGIRIEAWDETSESKPEQQPAESQRNLEGLD
ncbi:MAG: CDP-alcohol phosphatidyltransferase family protein [Deltaproteobacteria bacterium]|jgi:phosphatidylglycerophosphate synthase|nr:CDP-alcohol phosphatidyltransferase family protein [Deltaproteobacteria bacterium]